MNIQTFIESAARQGASDLHLEPGIPVTLRINNELRRTGPALNGRALRDAIRSLVGTSIWNGFLERRSADLSKTIGGHRCRIAILRSARGVGAAIRLLSSRSINVASLNLHPCLKAFALSDHGLVLVAGPTGSGKSTTIAAMVSEINHHQARHIITLEQPIEHALLSARSLVRQREVGRDTPSFEQGIMDVLREDPDVVVVGEMRWPQTIRLTITAAETGHLVFSTVHARDCAEAIGRLVSAFPQEEQSAVRAMLADSIRCVVSQQLLYRSDLGIRIPVLEVLTSTDAVRNIIRTGQLHKLGSIIETNAEAQMWSRQRYRQWLSRKMDWVRPAVPGVASAPELEPAPVESAPQPHRKQPAPLPSDSGVLILDGIDDDPASILSELS